MGLGLRGTDTLRATSDAYVRTKYGKKRDWSSGWSGGEVRFDLFRERCKRVGVRLCRLPADTEA